MSVHPKHEIRSVGTEHVTHNWPKQFIYRQCRYPARHAQKFKHDHIGKFMIGNFHSIFWSKLRCTGWIDSNKIFFGRQRRDIVNNA